VQANPCRDVRDWRQVERCIHHIPAFTGADGAAIVAITSRMKIFVDLCNQDCASEREVRQYVADLLLDRLKVESELYDARSPEMIL
jgi:hypothetical protein